MNIRKAAREDVPAINAIYNEAVLTTTASYDYEPRPLEYRMAWYDNHLKDNLPMWVAEEDGAIVGWSALNRYHDRFGYRFTTENSIYIAEPHRGRGIGALLLQPLVSSAKERGFHAIIAVIDAENQASIRLHRKFGFEVVGSFKQVGYKFDRWLDVTYMELLLPEPPEIRAKTLRNG
ncbi:MAG: GNAT family N-acetyltransferase [Verrucomicrobiales bacterium]